MTWYVVYLRVSTARQGASGLGIEAQREAVARRVASTGGRIVPEMVETESGKRSDRSELRRALAVCRAHRAAAAKSAKAAERAADLRPVIAEVRAAGIGTLTGIAKALAARGVAIPLGRGAWSAATVLRLERRPEATG